MDDESQVLRRLADEARSEAWVRMQVWSLLELFDSVPDHQRRDLYESALFTGLGAILHLAKRDPDLLQELQGIEDTGAE